MDQETKGYFLQEPQPKKSKTWILISLGLILSFIIAVLLVLVLVRSDFGITEGEKFEDSLDEEIVSVLISDCKKLSDDNKRNQCEQIVSTCKGSGVEVPAEYCDRFLERIAFDIAKETNDHRYCKQLEDYGQRNVCYGHVASKTGRVEICEKISEAEFQKECISEIPAILERIDVIDIPSTYKPNVKPEDYELYPRTELVHVRFNEGPGGSYSLKDEYHFASLDPKECEKVRNAVSVSQNNNVYANCIKTLSIINGDVKICRYISIDYEFNDCIRKFASEKVDATACFEIERPDDLMEEIENIDNSYRSFTGCLVQSIEQNPTKEGCELLSNTLYDNQNLADRCYLQLAEDSEDGVWCSYITLLSLQENCNGYLEVQNAENCGEISEIKLRDSCYRLKASEEKDPSYCGLISVDKRDFDDRRTVTKRDCYISMLFDIGDIEVCHDIEIFEIKESCYMTVNAYLNDGSDCDEIPDEFSIVKGWCYATAADWYGQYEYCEEIDSDLMDGERNIKETCLN